MAHLVAPTAKTVVVTALAVGAATCAAGIGLCLVALVQLFGQPDDPDEVDN